MGNRGVAELVTSLKTALGRGGHLLAVLVAAALGLVYLSGGDLRENPAKLVLLGFLAGTFLDATLSITWGGMHSLREKLAGCLFQKPM